MANVNIHSSMGYLAGVTPTTQGYVSFVQEKNALIQGRSVRKLPVLGSHVDRLLIIGALASSAIALAAIAALFIAPVGAFLGVETIVISSALGGMALGVYCFYNLIAIGFQKLTGSNALDPRRVKTNPTLWDNHRDKIAAVIGVAIFAICLFSVAAHFVAPLSVVAIPIHVLTAVMGSGVGLLLARRTIQAMNQLRSETKKINQYVDDIKPKGNHYQQKAEHLDEYLKRVIEHQEGLYKTKLIDEKQIQKELFLKKYICDTYSDDIDDMSSDALKQKYIDVKASNDFIGYQQKHFKKWLKAKKSEDDYAEQMKGMTDELYKQVLTDLAHFHTESLRRYACTEKGLDEIQAAWKKFSYKEVGQAHNNLQDEVVKSFTPLHFPTLLQQAGVTLSPEWIRFKLEVMLDQENWAKSDCVNYSSEADGMDLFQEAMDARIKNLLMMAKCAGFVSTKLNKKNKEITPQVQVNDPLETAIANLVEFEPSLKTAIENEEEIDLEKSQDTLDLLAKPIHKHAEITFDVLDKRFKKISQKN